MSFRKFLYEDLNLESSCKAEWLLSNFLWILKALVLKKFENLKSVWKILKLSKSLFRNLKFFFVLFCFFFFLMFIYFWGGKNMSGEGAETEVDRKSQAGSALSAQSLMQDLNSQTVRSLPESKPRVGHLLNWLSHPSIPI